jgi:hypothetical protein
MILCGEKATNITVTHPKCDSEDSDCECEIFFKKYLIQFVLTIFLI